MQYQGNLETMVGHVRRIKPVAPPDLIRDWLNHNMRQVLNKRQYWAGCRMYGVIPIPDQITGGSVTMTEGSTIVAGVGTSWPVNDVVNTTIPNGVMLPGPQLVTPANMDSIDANSVLYVDDAGTPEIVAVKKINEEQFQANFKFTHNANCTVWMSSLVHRQLRLQTSNPIYNIRAVPAANELIIDKRWDIASVIEQSYQILKMYVMIDQRIKYLEWAADPLLKLRLKINVPQKWLSERDPFRLATGSSVLLADNYPNENGNLTHEVYPPPVSARQLKCMYYIEWPDMVDGKDTPPPFIAPDILIAGALADALLLKLSANDEPNPMAARMYAEKFAQGVADAINADDAKALQSYEEEQYGMFGTMGADYERSHAPIPYAGYY
jgi:hypothetical protein